MIDKNILLDDLERAAILKAQAFGKEIENISYSYEDIRSFIEHQPETDRWIPCSERMPEEHDSIFAKLKGTEKWHAAMFEKTSDDVNVTVECEDGTRRTRTLHTIDGEWREVYRGVKFKVIAWQPLPESYMGKGCENK